MSPRREHHRPDEAAAAEVVRRMQDGDRAALGELYRLYRDGVEGWLAGQMRSCPADVEDIVHETFIRAAREAHTFDPADGEVGGWLRGWIARAALVDHRRGYRHSQLAAAGAIAAGLGRGRPESAHERETRPVSARVVVALSRLSPAQRRAVQLRYLDGQSEAAAAIVAGCAPNTIGRHTNDARKQLRAALADLKPKPRTELHAMSKKDAIYTAFEAVGRPDGAAVSRWLRDRDVHVAHTYVYQVLHGRCGPRPAVATAGSAAVDTHASTVRVPEPRSAAESVRAANAASSSAEAGAEAPEDIDTQELVDQALRAVQERTSGRTSTSGDPEAARSEELNHWSAEANAAGADNDYAEAVAA
jgi:RNA polymerase sigma-70 factor (ECF subfamily)